MITILQLASIKSHNRPVAWVGNNVPNPFAKVNCSVLFIVEIELSTYSLGGYKYFKVTLSNYGMMRLREDQFVGVFIA